MEDNFTSAVNSIYLSALNTVKLNEEEEETKMEIKDDKDLIIGDTNFPKMEIKDEKNPSAGNSDFPKNDLNKKFGIPIHGIYDSKDAVPDSACQCDTEKSYDSYIYDTFRSRSVLNSEEVNIFSGMSDKAKYVDTDSVNHPDHYSTGNYECIDVMEEVFGRDAVKDFCLCNAFKYIYRCKHKNNEEEDLEKAEWYLNRLIMMNKEDKE